MSYRMNPIEKEKRRLERLAFTTSLKSGDVLVNTWGYDQTNVDFYVVCSVSPSGKTVYLRACAAVSVPGSGVSHGMADNVAPDPENLTGPIFKKPVRPNSYGGDAVPMRFGYCRKWDGRPMYRSWYA